MPNAKVLKPRPAEPKLDALKPKARADGTGHRAKRASSCTRCCHDNARDPVAMETRGRAPAAASKARHGTTATAATSRGASRSQPPSTHTKARSEVHSHAAFTVFAPNPKKRRDIQRKAEAELAALEDLRLSRAVNYVSISPSAVGGRLTLEEVRTKQQQEMQTKRRQRQVKKYPPETSAMVCR